MQFTVLAGQEYFVACSVPAHVVDLEACLKQAIGSNFWEIYRVKREEEKRACIIRHYNYASLAVALDPDNGIFMHLESLD